MKPLLILVLAMSPAGDPATKVLLVGDSIRLGYAPIVAEKLKGKVEILSPKANAYDSVNMLKNLDAWLADKPAVVIFNCGLHDLKFKDGKYQVSPEEYEKNLHAIVVKLRKAGAKVVFATTTPIDDERHKQRKVGFDRIQASVEKFNEIARKVMAAEKVEVLDLHAIVVQGDKNKLLQKDGTHYTPEGNTLMATAVAEAVTKALK